MTVQKRKRPQNQAEFDKLFLNEEIKQGIVHNKFIFYGSESALIARINALSDYQVQSIKAADITVLGQKIHSPSILANVCVIILAVFFIFPLFIVCCEWYKKKTEPGFKVNPRVYESLQKLFQGEKLHYVNLTVYDNQFGKSKFNIMLQNFQGSKIKSLHFHNFAFPFGIDKDEYSNFLVNGNKLKSYLKSNRIKFMAVWDSQMIVC